MTTSARTPPSPRSGAAVDAAHAPVEGIVGDAEDDSWDSASWFERSGVLAWRVLGVLAVIGAVLWALSKVAVLLTGLLLALMITGALWAPVGWVTARGLPRVAATAAVMAVVLGAVGGVAVLVTDLVVSSAPQLAEQFVEGSRRIVASLPWLDADAVDRLLSQARDGGADLSQALSGVAQVATTAATLVLALVLSFLFLKDGREICRSALEHLRPDLRDDVAAVWSAMWDVVESYGRSLALVALLDATLVTLALTIIGVPLAVPIGVLTFLLSFVPVVGAFVAGFVATGVGFAHGGVAVGIAVAVSVALVQQLDSNVFQPWIMGHQLHLHPAAVVCALTAGGAVAGVWGALLGVPVVAAAVAGFERLRDRRRTLGPIAGRA